MSACSTRHRLRLILARGQLRPPLHPPEQDLRPVPPAGAISSAPGPSTVGRLRSPPGPPSTRRVPPWTCTRAVRPSTAAGLPRPCPTANRADWMPVTPKPRRRRTPRIQEHVMTSSGSQKRKVTARIAVNCTPAQKAAIMAKIDATGLSPSAMCLAVLLDVPLPPRRRPSVDTVLLAKVLSELAFLAVRQGHRCLRRSHNCNSLRTAQST